MAEFKKVVLAYSGGKSFGFFVVNHSAFLWQIIRLFCGKSFGFFVVNHSAFLWQIIRFFCGKSFGFFVVRPYNESRSLWIFIAKSDCKACL